MIRGRSTEKRRRCFRFTGGVLAAACIAGHPASVQAAGAGLGLKPPEWATASSVLLTAAPSQESSVRLPRPRPDPDAKSGAAPAAAQVAPPAAPEPPPPPQAYFGFPPDPTLRATIDAVAAGKYDLARALAAEHKEPLVAKLVTWMMARDPNSGLGAAEIIAVVLSHTGWPEADRLRLRAEQAFHALGPDGPTVLTFYSLAPPRTIGGKLALAGALRGAGREDEATSIVRTLWREDTLSQNQAATVLTRFGAALTKEDHLYRFRRLVLNARSAEAKAQAQLVGKGYDELARAVIAVIDRSNQGARLLKAVAPKFLADPLYTFARVRQLRRSGEHLEAARLLIESKADAEIPGDPDIWWDERRDLSRAVLDRRTPDLAYQLVTSSSAAKDSSRVEAAFHAGWYALRFMDDPDRAEPHFRELHSLASLPRTRARAAYWLGRTFSAQGKEPAARLAYGEAAQFGSTFYGQLAREELGLVTTGLERMPAPSALDRLRFADREGVKIIRLLAAAGYTERALPFFRGLAERIDSPGEITLLTSLARRIKEPHAGIIAATVAEQRGVRVASLPAPFLGVPKEVPLPEAVDRPLVYSVVRQESAFNHQATSHVGAQGLMQLMPATAKATARSVQMPFSVQRLTTDPLYNATLGAAHLRELLDNLNSSYVLTFVAYNAGPGRARDWVRAYGDLRGGAVDPVDWIERIPFDETRNYVQKVMENLQIYRSRIGHPLSISEDLIRGGPQG